MRLAPGVRLRESFLMFGELGVASEHCDATFVHLLVLQALEGFVR